MTIKKQMTILIAAAMVAAAPAAYAQQSSADDAPAAEQAVSQIRVKGLVEKTDDGVALNDGDTLYMLKGEKDFSSYIGKTVLVTGRGASSEQGMEILVEQLVEVK